MLGIKPWAAVCYLCAMQPPLRQSLLINKFLLQAALVEWSCKQSHACLLFQDAQSLGMLGGDQNSGNSSFYKVPLEYLQIESAQMWFDTEGGQIWLLVN